MHAPVNLFANFTNSCDQLRACVCAGKTMAVTARLVLLLAACCFALLPASHAQPLAPAKYVAGTHYQILPQPVKTVADDKIEVMEVFWYGCSHCQSFEPLIHGWQKSLADDVAFARTPAVWQKMMRSHAALYYVAEALELPHSVHNDLFNLLVKNRRLDDEKKFASVFARYDVAEQDFNKLYKSFGTISKVNQAEKRLKKNYLSQGTPELIVNGKYRIGSRMAGSQAQMLDVANFLIDLERQAMRANSAAKAASAEVARAAASE